MMTAGFLAKEADDPRRCSEMLEGLMQHDYPLTLTHILERMRRCYGDDEVVTVTDEGKTRASFAEVTERVDRLAAALRTLGVEAGDRVGSFAWNTQRHLELYLAVPCSGAVLHMINMRLSDEQLVYVVNHAKDRVVFVDDSLVPSSRRWRRASRRFASSSSAPPLSLLQEFEERLGVPIIELWGMTETTPLCSAAWPPASASGEEHWRLRDTAGRILPLVEARIVGDNGEELPWDGEATGELEVRGPFIASSYYNDPSSPEKFDGEWLRTGDMAWINPKGFIKVTDRTKDVIKSGGEWISSVQLEAELVAHPDVVEAAVIAKPDERWAERPLACVVLDESASSTPGDLREHLARRVPKWWLPDEFAFIGEIPKTSVGKFDKKSCACS
jgi:fatty-acyl-CoA synthase